jgi:hypothetical protein
MEAICPSETLVDFKQVARCFIIQLQASESNRDLVIPGTVYVWRSNIKIGPKNIALLSDLNFKPKYRSMQPGILW